MLISKKRVQAFTMIETLVALVIISIGILGFALMQVESLKAAKIALFAMQLELQLQI